MTAISPHQSPPATPRRHPAGVNALRVLELLVDRPDGLGITDLAQALAMDNAQVHRVVNGLRSAEYVAKTESSPPRYVVTARVLRLAARLLDRSDIIRVSRPIMVGLRDQTGETVQLAAIVDGTPVSVAHEISQMPVSVLTRIGQTWPIDKTAMGWAVAAFNGADVEDDPELASRLEAVRRLGYAVDREVYVHGVVGICSPIFDFRGEVVGAIGIAGPTDRMLKTGDDLSEFGALVLEGAQDISANLGAIDVDTRYHIE